MNLASKLGHYANIAVEFEDKGNWNSCHEAQEYVEKLVKEHLPSGSGFDSGVEVDWDATKKDKLVLKSGFHHMNEDGYYDGWSHFQVIVFPSFTFCGFDMKIKSIGCWHRRYIDTKEYVDETFFQALNKEVGE